MFIVICKFRDNLPSSFLDPPIMHAHAHAHARARMFPRLPPPPLPRRLKIIKMIGARPGCPGAEDGNMKTRGSCSWSATQPFLDLFSVVTQRCLTTLKTVVQQTNQQQVTSHSRSDTVHNLRVTRMESFYDVLFRLNSLQNTQYTQPLKQQPSQPLDLPLDKKRFDLIAKSIYVRNNERFSLAAKS